jgi:lysozyme
MKARHQVSRNAVTLIKRFEGYRAKAAQLANGRWTIGYGHTLTAREGATVSAQDAEALLLYDLIAVAHAINEHSYTPLNQNQFDALASFAFNIGVENFQRSAVLRRINEGALIQAACSMEMWRKADFGGERIVIDALVRRRSAEKNLFLTPPDGWIAAPSPILPPKVDYDASYAVPRQAPAPVVSPLEGERAEARLDTTAAVVPVPPDEDQLPTLSERAAAAVSARLEAILPDDPVAQGKPDIPAPPTETAFDVPPIPDGAPPEPSAPTLASAFAAPFIAQAEEPASAPAEDAFTLSPPPEVESEPTPQPAPEPETPAPTETLFDRPLRDKPPAWGARLDEEHARGVVASFDPAFPLDSRRDTGRIVPLLLLALVGLVFFAGGVFWGFSAAPDSAGGLPTAKAIGWLMGVVGVTCFGAAAYLLLRRLDTGDED